MRDLVAAPRSQAERVVKTLYKGIEEPAAFCYERDIQADLEPFPYPVTERQVCPVGFTIQGDLFQATIVDRKVGGNADPQLGGEVATWDDSSIVGRLQAENLHNRALV